MASAWSLFFTVDVSRYSSKEAAARKSDPSRRRAIRGSFCIHSAEGFDFPSAKSLHISFHILFLVSRCCSATYQAGFAGAILCGFAPSSSSARSLRSMTSPSRSARVLDSAERCSGDKTATSSKSLSSSAGPRAAAPRAVRPAQAPARAAPRPRRPQRRRTRRRAGTAPGRRRRHARSRSSVYQAARDGAHCAALLLRVCCFEHEIARGAKLELIVARLLPPK